MTVTIYRLGNHDGLMETSLRAQPCLATVWGVMYCSCMQVIEDFCCGNGWNSMPIATKVLACRSYPALHHLLCPSMY